MKSLGINRKYGNNRDTSDLRAGIVITSRGAFAYQQRTSHSPELIFAILVFLAKGDVVFRPFSWYDHILIEKL